MPRPQKLSLIERLSLVEDHSKGVSVRKLMDKYGVSSRFIFRLTSTKPPAYDDTGVDTNEVTRPLTKRIEDGICYECFKTERIGTPGMMIKTRFPRFKGEHAKMFCSKECYDTVKKNGRFSRDVPWDSTERDRMAVAFVASNACFFESPEDLKEDNDLDDLIAE